MPEGKEEFSAGQEASIRRVTPEEKERFPEADLVREWKSIEKNKGRFIFLLHQVAQNLFPEHFIEVVGHEAIANEGQGGEFKLTSGKLYYERPALYKIYSKELAVDPDHAVYTKHATYPSDLGSLTEKVIHDCEVCRRHNVKHEEMKKGLVPVVEKLAAVGLQVPHSDPTDYCTVDDRIVFFEIDLINAFRVRRYMDANKDLSLEARERVEQALDQLGF